MILSTIVIVGAASTLGISVKAYREQKRKREFPWTVAAERMAKKELALVKRRHSFGAQEGMSARVTSSIRKGQTKSLVHMQEIIAPFIDETRNQQLAEITGSDLGEVQMEKKAKRKLYVSSASLLLISAGILFYAPLYVPGILGLVYIYSSLLKGGYHGLVKEHRINVDALMAAIVTGAFVGGFFFVMALACWYGSIMHWLLNKIENNSRKNLVNLLGEPPRFVWMVVDGVEVEVLFENMQIGDQVVVVAGQMIPIDGTISAGMASIDQHILTGEEQPAEKGKGERVFASTVVLSGKITVRVEKTGQEMVAAQIGQILNSMDDFNQAMKSRVESALEPVIPSWIALSAASLPWLGLNGALAALWCCPGYRIFMLGPVSMLNYLHILSKNEVLVKDARSLERLNDIDTIVLDKTGTLTVGKPTVSQIFSCSTLSASQLLTYAAAAEYRQNHPVAKAILEAADIRQLVVPQIEHTHYEIGYGVKVNLDERVIRVGSDRFMEGCGITIPLEIKKEQSRCRTRGYSLVYVAIDDQLGGAIELVPIIRPEAKEVVRSLREMGKTLIIISGDHEAPTRRLAQELGIDRYFANTLPENKAQLVSQLQEEGRSVCFVGDGINDAIALKQANVSISLRGATPIAMDTAHIVLMNGNLERLTYIFELAEEFNQNLNRSFMMVLIPDIIGIAGAFFFHWGLLAAVIFKSSCWIPQLGNVMQPLYKHRETNKQLRGS